MVNTEMKKSRYGGAGVSINNILPEELIIQVLKELPVHCLVRCRCVSKQWLSIIDNPYFVCLHRERSHSRPDGVTFQIEKKGLTCLYTPSAIERYCYKFENEVEEEAELIAEEEAEEETTPYGIFHPYMCVEGLTLSIEGNIRNHSTRKKIWIPPPPPHPTCLPFSRWRRSFLGFNPLTKEYKLLYIGSGSGSGSGSGMTKGKVIEYIATIHTLGTSSWRRIDVPIDLDLIHVCFHSVTFTWPCCVNGVLYMIYSKHRNYSILPFELGTEKFRPLIPFPPEVITSPCPLHVCQLYDFGGNLLLFIPCAEFSWILVDEEEDVIRWKKERAFSKRRYPDLYNLLTITFPNLDRVFSGGRFRSFRHVETLFSTNPPVGEPAYGQCSSWIAPDLNKFLLRKAGPIKKQHYAYKPQFGNFGLGLGRR